MFKASHTALTTSAGRTGRARGGGSERSGDQLQTDGLARAFEPGHCIEAGESAFEFANRPEGPFHHQVGGSGLKTQPSAARQVVDDGQTGVHVR